VDPGPAVIWPAGHELQDSDPTEEAKVFAGHWLQEIAPELPLKLPAGHAAQVELLVALVAALNEPGGQLVEVEEPAGQ
jgi:hypothetical protein